MSSILPSLGTRQKPANKTVDHVRIDEGVKRGPRKKPVVNIKKRDAKTGRALTVMPVDLLPPEVIDRYLSDERTADIAASYGVQRSRLNQWLLEHAEEPWRKAQVARAVTAMEQAKDDLASATDPLTLARAREQLRAAQWELERLFNRLYGQKQEVTHLGAPVLNITFSADVAPHSTVIDAEHKLIESSTPE